MIRRALLSVVLAAILVPASARADDENPKVAAEALFGEGRTLVKKGDYAGACAKFADSNRLDPAVGTAFNLADCEEHLGHLATSWELWRHVVDSLASHPGDVRAPIAGAHVASLEPRLPHVVLSLAADAPPDTVVRLDGLSLGQSALGAPLPLDPGSHAIVVESTGRKPTRVEVAFAEGESRAITLAAGEALPPPPPASAGDAPTRPDPTRRTIALVVGAVGVVGIGVGSYFGLHAASQYSDAQRTSDEAGVQSARTSGNTSTAAFVAGGVLAATGVVLWFTAPRVPSAGAQVAIVPALGDRAASLGLLVRFE